MIDGIMFTSRSAVEAYQECNRYRYLQSFYQNIGVVRVQKSVPLVTGSAVHRGVEHLLNRVRLGETPEVETAVLLAVKQYVEDVGAAGFSGSTMKTDAQQWFTFNEQKALVEALVRAWGWKELPQIQTRYRVIGVERDIEPIEMADGVLFQAKVDAEFEEIKTGDYHNYSLKTTAQWGERNEESFKSDLQGVTEIWAMEEDAKRANRRLDEAIKKIQEYADGLKITPKGLVDIAVYLSKKKVDKKISGIRFCYLVKGKRMVPPSKKNEENAIKITYNPLIRGYKNFSPAGIAYAHSWNYPNPNTSSGTSILGKGWEPFNVWEDPMGVKGWMELLATGEVQPSCGDVIKQQVVTPPEYWRSEDEMQEAIEEITAQEKRVRHGMLAFPLIGNSVLAQYFPHNRKHCNFHFGDVCEYAPACWKPEVSSNLIESGLYQIRTPHHDAERENR